MTLRPTRALCATALLAASLASAPAQADIVNALFGQGLNGWDSYGDVAVEGGDTLVLTTATAAFEDDAPRAAGYFNVSGQDAGAVGTADGLEHFVGVPVGSLDPDPVNHTVALYEGSAARQTFSVLAGQTLSFSWNLFTADVVMPDPALLILDRHDAGQPVQAVTLSTANLALNPVAGGELNQTGYQLYSHTFTQAGSVTLAWAVADHGDYNGSSLLKIRALQLTPAVPEPGTVAMVLAGVAMMLFIGYRQRSRR